MRICLASLLFTCWSFTALLGQKPAETEEEYEKKYQQRIQQTYIYGVYIPADLTDAFEQLNKLVDRDSKKAFKNVEEGIAARKLHFSLGRWMIHNWGFYGGSRLSDHIKKLGIHHPDDMARLIIITYHRYLNKKDLEIKALVESFRAKQEAEKEARKNRGKVITEEKRIREKEG
jgi:hypothetical protein